jgi:hypothetical protein
MRNFIKSCFFYRGLLLLKKFQSTSEMKSNFHYNLVVTKSNDLYYTNLLRFSHDAIETVTTAEKLLVFGTQKNWEKLTARMSSTVGFDHR